MAGTDNNGPRVGEGNRMRNTLANTLSKNTIDYTNPGGASALPSLDPASTANYYSQLSGLYAGYQNQLLALKQQRIGARADFSAQAAQVRAQKVGDLASVENQSIERGISGSSADLQQRAGVEGAAAAGIQAAKRQRGETVSGTHIAGQQAGIDYFMGAQGLEAQKLAQQQQLLSDQLERNLIVSGQETTMDALKGIFESLSAAGTNTVNKTVNKYNTPATNKYGGMGGVPDAAGNVQFWLKLGMDQQAASQNARMVREGAGPGSL
jgi:hypothetical protein